MNALSKTAVLLGFVLMLPLCGCGGGAGSAQTANDLRQIGLAYHNFNEQHGRGPVNADLRQNLCFSRAQGG